MLHIIFLLPTIAFGQTYSTKNQHITQNSSNSVNYSTRDMGDRSKAPNMLDNLTEEDCRRLVINTATNDSVTYKPGIDSNGNKVAAADLPGSPGTKDYKLGDEVHIDLQGKLRNYAPTFPAPVSGNKDFIDPVLRDSDVGIGSIDVHKDGKMWINGVPTFDEDQAKLEEACRKKFPNL